LSIDDFAAYALELGGKAPTRVQRPSATRAAHRVLRRVRELEARADGHNRQPRNQIAPSRFIRLL
jgi:hypothetical protein